MLLEELDVTAGLTLAPAPAVATVRQESRWAPTPAVATVPQQGAFSAPPSLAVCSYKETVDYLTILPLILLLSLIPSPWRSSPSAL